MGSSPSPPAAPDPKATASAQTQMNDQSALYQAQLNNVNQVTPYGNETFTQSGGGQSYNMDAYNQAMQGYQAAIAAQASAQSQNNNPYGYGGQQQNNRRNQNTITPPQLSDFANPVTAPQFTSTITLSPAEQKLLDNQQSLQTQQQGIAGTALNQAQANQQNPYDLSGLPQLASASNIADAEAAGTKDVMRLMQPQMDRDNELLQSRLANQGVTQGSQAYNSALLEQQQANQAAYSQAALTGVQAGQTLQNEALTNNQQAVANYTQQYNAPINEYQALQNGVQVQNPSFAPAGNTQVAPTNYLGAVQNAYQAQLNSYNANTASNNSALGGLFGLGGSFLGAGGLSMLGSAGAGSAGDAAFMAMFA